MYFTCQDLCKASGYKLDTILKLLTKSGVSNHFELSKNDLYKLYCSLNVVTFKSLLLKNYLRDVLKDDVLKVLR